jgi:hypothetical protein
MSSHDPGIGEEYIQSTIFLDSFVDDGLYGGFVGGVELPGVDVDGGVEGAEFVGVGGEVGVVVVAEVDGAGAVAGELVGGGAADAGGGVCSWRCWWVGWGWGEEW